MELKLWGIILLLFSIPTTVCARTGKPIRGIITDEASGEGLAAATVTVLNYSPFTAVTSDNNGNFSIENLPAGRYDIRASYLGYEPVIFREINVSPAKEVFLTLSLKENITSLEEITVTPKINKQNPINSIATTSARMLSVEEASRYAGGMDDPARLVTSFAGIAGSMNSNGIAIRGNSPQFLQWRLEGVAIPNPTHFSDITGPGGGIFTALSSQVLGNSDFFTGAFPAEYGNALSGIFDMQLRNGNRWTHEHTVQIGTLGIDVSSEGPLKKGGQSSYLFNYRYATMALANDLFPGLLGGAAGMRYQDLSFKFNFPTRKAGTFSLWGIGITDHFLNEAEKDQHKWESISDKSDGDFKQLMGVGGIGHKYFIDNNTYIKSALAATYTKNELFWEVFDTHPVPTRANDMKGNNRTVSLNSYLNKKFSAKYINRTGFNVSGLGYKVDYNVSPSFPNASLPMENFAKSKGSTLLFSAFSNSTIRYNNAIILNIGLHGQYFLLNKHSVIEPRAGIKWQMRPAHFIGIAYGKHSRLEKLDYYFVKTPETGDYPANKKLDFAKAHHIVFSYSWSISNDMYLKVEPYFQYLYDVPVTRDSSYSIINHTDWYLNNLLVNDGKGKNYGIDITFERYLKDGYYYMLTGSLFESRYTGGDKIWRDTRLNRNFLFNALGGKEWKTGKEKQNLLAINLRFSFQGGERYSPINESESLLQEDAVYDTTRAYEEQCPPALISSLTTSYKINRKNLAHEFAVKIINVNGYEEFDGHYYNYKKKRIEMYKSAIVIPNISYKIEF